MNAYRLTAGQLIAYGVAVAVAAAAQAWCLAVSLL